MKRIIFQDGDKQDVIELKDHVMVEEIYYRIYRFHRKKGWFDFNWDAVNTLEDRRLHELVPDLSFFKHEGKKRVAEFNWFCHEYSIELGQNTIAMADKIVKKFHDMVTAEHYTGDSTPEELKLAELISKVEELRTQIAYKDPAKAPATVAELKGRLAEWEEKKRDQEAKLETMRNHYYVPGVSGENKLKFALWKPGAQRSTCNIVMSECKEGIPTKVKKMLLQEVEKDPNFKYILRMYIAFNYLDSIPGAEKYDY